MKTLHTVEDVRKYFDVNYGYVNLGAIPDKTISEFLNRGYIINLSFKRQMDCLYDYILSQDLCGVEE